MLTIWDMKVPINMDFLEKSYNCASCYQLLRKNPPYLLNQPCILLLYFNLLDCSKMNFICLACKLFWPLVLSYNFTQRGWRIPFGPDDFPGHIEFSESPTNYLFLKILQTGRTYFCPLLYLQQLTTMKRAVWFMDPWVYTSRSRGFPVKNELDKLIPPLTIQLLHSWTTFSSDLHTSLLQQTGPCIMAEYFIPDLPSNSWTFRSTLWDPGVPSCKWIRWINSASDNSATSFLDTP